MRDLGLSTSQMNVQRWFQQWGRPDLLKPLCTAVLNSQRFLESLTCPYPPCVGSDVHPHLLLLPGS